MIANNILKFMLDHGFSVAVDESYFSVHHVHIGFKGARITFKTNDLVFDETDYVSEAIIALCDLTDEPELRDEFKATIGVEIRDTYQAANMKLEQENSELKMRINRLKDRIKQLDEGAAAYSLQVCEWKEKAESYMKELDRVKSDATYWMNRAMELKSKREEPDKTIGHEFIYTGRTEGMGWLFGPETLKINWPEDSMVGLKNKIKKLEVVNAGLTLEVQEYGERVEKLKADLEETYRFKMTWKTKALKLLDENKRQEERIRTLEGRCADLHRKASIKVFLPEARIDDVKFNGPATIVFWSDGDKTVVKAGENDYIDYEKGLAMAIAKKKFGTNKSKSNYYDLFRKWLPKDEEPAGIKLNLVSVAEAIKIMNGKMNPPIEDDKKEEDDLK